MKKYFIAPLFTLIFFSSCEKYKHLSKGESVSYLDNSYTVITIKDTNNEIYDIKFEPNIHVQITRKEKKQK